MLLSCEITSRASLASVLRVRSNGCKCHTHAHPVAQEEASARSRTREQRVRAQLTRNVGMYTIASRLCRWCACRVSSSASMSIEWVSCCMLGPADRMPAALRRVGVGAARWRRRPGRCPRPFLLSVSVWRFRGYTVFICGARSSQVPGPEHTAVFGHDARA
eukprot:3480872-Prymnesium_polylepis.1